MFDRHLTLRFILCVGTGAVVLLSGVRFELPIPLHLWNNPDNLVSHLPRGPDLKAIKASATNYSTITARQPQPKVAWLMSFGGAGTSFTIMNTERTSGLTTGTNYGRDLDPELTADSAPFRRTLSKPLPSTYMLTQTHCGGYCIECSPSLCNLNTTEFQKACLTAYSPHGTVVYSPSIPKKAVHLVRNPFDSLVGRMHLAIKHGLDIGISDSVQGVKHYCDYMDAPSVDEERDPMLVDIFYKYRDLPCYSEWYKYVQWHNRAVEVSENLGLPVKYLFYENYIDNFDDTIRDLHQFLELPIDHSPLKFMAEKTYGEVFEESQRHLAVQFVREMASEPVWGLLAHYFAEISVVQDRDVTVASPYTHLNAAQP